MPGGGCPPYSPTTARVLDPVCVARWAIARQQQDIWKLCTVRLQLAALWRRQAENTKFQSVLWLVY